MRITSDNQLVRKVHRLPPWVAGTSALISLAALIGWAFDIPQLKSMAVGLTTMKINTAIGLLLGAMAIIGFRLPTARWRWFSYPSAALMAAIGLLTLGEYVFGINFHIDNLFMMDREAHAFPGRLSPATGVCFVVIPVAIFLLHDRRTSLLAQALFIVSSLPAAVAIGGYALGVPGMYMHVAYPAVAINTAVCVTLLCVAGLLEHPDQGLMRIVTSPHLAGGVSRKLLPVGAALPLLVGLAVVTGQSFGWYTERFAFSLVVTSCAVLYIAATWWTTWLLLEQETADIARRQIAETDLLRAKDAAEAANRAKDQFMAVLSHELRTPLTPVLATVELMERDLTMSAETRESVEMIRRNIQLEARLIDDLLDLTRIARGKIKLHQEAVDVHTAITRTIATLQSEIDLKHLNIELELQAGNPAVWADPTRFQQVQWNVLGNAIKFTPEHGRISIRTRNEADDRLIIQISDNGVGIEPELLPLLFNAFQQGEATISRRFGGLGLGLSISKSLLEMHGGTITAGSAGKDKGATLTIAMQAMKSADVVINAGNPAIPATTTVTADAPRRILLVEDNNDTLKIMKLLLKKLGFEVITADCVKAALELGSSQQFDLLVSDIGLPDGSGWDIMTNLKRVQNIRGVAISGFGMEEDLKRSKAAGFEQHLVKPVSFELLRDTVKEVAGPAR